MEWMPRKQSRRTRDDVGQGEGQAGRGGGGAADPITACRWLHARGWRRRLSVANPGAEEGGDEKGLRLEE